MSRRNRYLLSAFTALLAAAAPALSADVLLNDNFIDAGNWTKSDVSAQNASAAVNGGYLTIDNTAGAAIAEYIHSFGANKPAVFTLSYILNSKQGRIAGALFCRQPGNSPNGYLLTTAAADTIVIYKITSDDGINAASIVYQHCADLNPADNKLTVSKNGPSFNIFVNDLFQFSFSDNSYGAGDISLLLFNNSKAVFGNVRVTDEFTPGIGRTEFSDDFDDGVINKYWRQDIKSESGTSIISETDGKLRMTSGSGSAAFIYIDINLTDFSAKVEATHLSGRADKSYGIFLLGGNTSQMRSFLITGGGYYYVSKPGTSYSVIKDQIISGVSGTANILEIKKNEASPNYEFIVNGKSLDIGFLGPIDFDIKGIGLFCQDSLSVAFDNFEVKQNHPVTSVRQNGKKQISRTASPPTARDRAFYDMRGRIRYSTASAQNRMQTRAAGVYVNKNGRDVAVRKGKAVSE